jgi:hypothetical protein
MADDGNGSLRLSPGTVRLIIEVVTTALLVSSWGWSIKMQIAVQDVKIEQVSRDAAMARVQVEEMWKQMAGGQVNFIRRHAPDKEPE